MYSILQSKWYQSKAFVQALLDASGDILHTLPNGYRDSLWAYPGANKHGYLLKQLHNSKVRKCVSSQNSNGNSISKVTNCKVRDCTSSLIPNQSSSMVNSNGKITASASSLTQITDKKQCGGNSDEAQVYTLRTEVTSIYSNAEIIQLLQNPDENKLTYVMPIKPKGGEVYILDWQGNDSKLKDYVADQYIWVADCTKTTTHSGVQLVKRYFKIHDDSGIECSTKLSHSKEFKKTVSFLKCNPFLQLIEYTGNENVYKPRVHGNTKHLTNGILGMQWLTSDHMSNVNKLMIKDEYSLHGFQDTLLAPVKKKNGTWHIPASGFKNQK